MGAADNVDARPDKAPHEKTATRKIMMISDDAGTATIHTQSLLREETATSGTLLPGGTTKPERHGSSEKPLSGLKEPPKSCMPSSEKMIMTSDMSTKRLVI